MNTLQKYRLRVDSIAWAGLIVLLLLLLKECNSRSAAEGRLAQSQQNIKALRDTVNLRENRVGELQAERLVFIANEKELRGLNAALAEEIRKQKGQVMQLTSANASLKSQIRGLKTRIEEEGASPVQEITAIDPGTYPERNFKLLWEYDTTYSSGNAKKLAGFTRVSLGEDGSLTPGLTDITLDVNTFKIVTGLTKEGDDYKIFMKSDHPGFAVSELEGAIVPGKNNPLFPTPKKIGWDATIGPNISYGVGPGGPGVFLGVGLTVGLGYRIK